MTELLTCCFLSWNGIAGLFSKHSIHCNCVLCIGQQPTQFNIGVGLSNFHLKRAHVIRLWANVYYSRWSELTWIKVRLHRINLFPHNPFIKQASVRICSLSHHFILGTDAMEPYKTKHTRACCFRITPYIWTSGNCSETNSVNIWSLEECGWNWIRNVL